MLPPGGKRFSLILYRIVTKCTFNMTKNVCCYWCLEKKCSVESFTLVMFWSAAIPDPADSCVCQGCDPNQQWNKMTIRTCLIARGLYNTRHLTNRAVIKVNSESPLSVSALSPSASQRTTRPRRTWRDTRRTRPTPTLSVTTWPIWEPLPGTRRNTATRSAWRQAMVGVTANVTPLASSQLEPLNKNTGDRLIKIATL